MSSYLSLYESFKKAYSNSNKNTLIKEIYSRAISLEQESAIILLKIFKENKEDISKLVETEKLVYLYTKTIYGENREFIIQELKERNFNTDNLIFV